MKRILFSIIATLVALTSCSKFDDTQIWDKLNDHEERIVALETLCGQINTNIASLQAIIQALQENDYITNVVAIMENGVEVGYQITFSKGKTITIYHGKDGKDGVNGTDGKDGHDGAPGADGKDGVDGAPGADGKDGVDGTDGKDGQDGQDGVDGQTPVIGVKQDTDGVYYWTLNGEWMLDDNGNKIPTTGKDGADGKDGQNGTDGKDGQDGVPGADGEDGKDGADGSDGKDGVNGTDGKDGITPQLKIENDYWHISYDNGATWTRLGKATGEDGKDGDSFFSSVTKDEHYVYFILTDGTQIKVRASSYTTQECVEAFIEEMNMKAKHLRAGNSSFVDPIGVSNISTAADMTRIMLYASDYDKLYDIWNAPDRTIRIIQEDKSVREMTVSSTVLKGKQSHCLSSFYNIIGGKTGTLSNKNAYNLLCICQSARDPEDWYIIAAFNAYSSDNYGENRFQAAKEIMDMIESENDTTADPLDEIAWEGLTYRDIFIVNNAAMRVNNCSTDDYVINSGSPEVIALPTDVGLANFAPPYAIKCFGNISQQYKSDYYLSDFPYFVASNIRVDRYSTGYCGIAFDHNFAGGLSELTDGWVTKTGIIEDDGKDEKLSRIYLGSASSADLDGYVNNPVVVPLSIFSSPPTEEQFKELYNSYTTLLIEAGGTDNIDDKYTDVCCSNAYAIKMPAHHPKAYRNLEIPHEFTKNADNEVYPASTTKILTSILLLDYVADLKETVKIKQEELDMIPTGYYGNDLLAGEGLTFEDLLYALYLPSSNSAAMIIASNVGERILRSRDGISN